MLKRWCVLTFTATWPGAEGRKNQTTLFTFTVTIEAKGDSKKEASESFYLDLFGLSSNTLFTKNRGIGTILNDD